MHNLPESRQRLSLPGARSQAAFNTRHLALQRVIARVAATHTVPMGIMPGSRYLLCVLLGALWTPFAFGQAAQVRGFVTDSATGEPLINVNIILENAGGDLRGAATDVDGIYSISRLDPGAYVLTATFIGYRAHVDSLLLRTGERLTLNFALEESAAELDEVVVEAELETGAANITAGLQTIRPQDIEVIPSPDISGDLASFLTALPGVVTLGDRGGQFFVRGGEPSHNLTMIDGMYVHQPYHILGFYSAFPADIIQQADIHSAGYGGPYTGRISSVINIQSRNGNKNRYAGAASVSPFVSGLQFEGPLVRERASIMASLRQSVVEQAAERYVAQDMPYTFGDAFAKAHALLSHNSQLSVSALHTYDRGTIGLASEDQILESIGWRNSAVGIRYVVLPRALPFIAEVQLSYSRLETEQGPRADPVRWSRVHGFHYAANMTSFYRRTQWKWGLYWRAPEIRSELGGVFQNLEIGLSRRHKAGLYLEPDFNVTSRLKIRASLITEIFPGQRNRTLFEPRFRAIWDSRRHEASLAAGYYHQEIFGLNDRRDATNVFTAWRSAPEEDLSRAVHALAGYRFRPAPWLELSAEGFYKRLRNLFIAEWTSFPRFTTRLQRADGRVMGVEARAELRQRRFYGYVNYGLSSVQYVAKEENIALWFGTERLEFRPPHDRRHQLNIVANTRIGEYDISVRWNFGSGRPYTRVYGFDGFVHLDGVQDLFTVPDDQRVIYGRPFGGVLPTYHRLDASLERQFEFERGVLAAQIGVINLYDRRNLFALDLFTTERNYQLPVVPTLGLRIELQ